MLVLVGKIIFLFIAIWFTIINVTRSIRQQSIHTANFILQAIGLTGFIVLQWII